MEENIEMRGIPQAELQSALLEIGATETLPRMFQGDLWEVSLSEETFVTLGVIRLPVTQLKFRGEAVTLKAVLKTFRLKTLRGGG
ncbi:hypothetical protein GJ688_07170 [Heliobacillus mobilis]|uniref:Molybdopterin cofactor biosynthesis MoaD-related C-terminal domain-containing protein n=1 Tax=Heliobacterium mobile TaxID=28064 RepID=A0A6I3SIT7_HELMO|nr:hypothetical protein [Heliobacterium mobile]MTV48760.1 hypothetical protein [Heliobacterium mobile]